MAKMRFLLPCKSELFYYNSNAHDIHQISLLTYQGQGKHGNFHTELQN